VPQAAPNNPQVSLDAAWRSLATMAEGLIAALPALVAGLIVAGAIAAVARPVQRVVENAATRSGIAGGAGMVLGRLARWGTVLAAVLVGMMIILPSFTPAQLISSLGIGSVAVGFAFRDVLQNFLAGLLILAREPFSIGDQIVVDGHEGTVEDIEVRATLLRTYDGRRIVIPNADVFTNAVIVNTAYPARRGEIAVGVSYSADLRQAKAVIVAALAEVDGVLADPAPDVLVTGFGDSSVDLLVRWWSPAQRGDVVAAGDEAAMAVKDALDGAGVEIPFPMRVVELKDANNVGGKSAAT